MKEVPKALFFTTVPPSKILDNTWSQHSSKARAYPSYLMGWLKEANGTKQDKWWYKNSLVFNTSHTTTKDAVWLPFLSLNWNVPFFTARNSIQLWNIRSMAMGNVSELRGTYKYTIHYILVIDWYIWSLWNWKSNYHTVAKNNNLLKNQCSKIMPCGF